MVSQSAKILVGRQREMAELNAALDCAMAGHGRLVMLAGEPGIGKTRIAQELAGLAEQRGARVLWGWCYEQEGAPPYWPWVQPVRSYISATEPDRLRAEMGPGAADIAEVIPEVRGKLPDLEPPPALDPNQARFRLFDSFATLFKNAAESQPLMLVLDDLHWADKPSLLLLEFLARQISESSLLIVGTYRDAEVSPDHPLFGTLAQLSRDQSFRRQVLTGLPPADVGEFILTTSGANASQELIETLYADTEGNPFFMNEVIRLLVDRGELGNASVGGGAPALAVPQSVLEVIGQRLNRLSKECNDLLTTAAVIGRQFDFNLLGILSEGATELELVELVEEALQAQIIQGLPEAGDRYQFSHALVQQTLLERLSTRRRVRLHAKVGEALETLYGEYGGDHAAELAYHFAEAEPVAGPDKLVKYTTLAGERALEAFAHEDALRHFQRGLIAKGLDEEGSMPVPDAEAAALLFGLGRAQAVTLGRQQLDVAFATLNRAFDFYAETNDVTHAVRIAGYSVQILVGHRVAGELVARALRLAPHHSPEAGRLLSRYGLVVGLEEGDYPSAKEAFDSALATAQTTADAALEMRTLANFTTVDYWHLQWTDTIAKGSRLIEQARLAADQLSEVSTRFWVGIALLNSGESSEAQRHAAEMLSTAESLRSRYWLATALWLNERASSYEGNWQAAKEFNERGLLASPSDTRLLGTRMLMEYETGDDIQGHGYLERLVEALRLVQPGPKYDYASVALLISAVARIAHGGDQLHIAESSAATVLSADSATPLISRFARIGLSFVAVLRGDVEAAKEQYASLGLAAGSILFIAIDRVLGLLAQTMGDLDQAVIHFEDALAFCRKAGYRPELAWTCHDYAEMLLARGNGRTPLQDDRSKALSLLEDALAVSTELGMRPLRERVTALQERAESAPVVSPAYPDGLTQREVEVLRLVAAGKTDREIAEELVISTRTVTTHVGNILNKVAAANRTEAASYAHTNGLVGPNSEVDE